MGEKFMGGTIDASVLESHAASPDDAVARRKDERKRGEISRYHLECEWTSVRPVKRARRKGTEIRAIALGRRNWLFCWTEVGAQYVGIVQSLIASCRLQGIDP